MGRGQKTVVRARAVRLIVAGDSGNSPVPAFLFSRGSRPRNPQGYSPYLPGEDLRSWDLNVYDGQWSLGQIQSTLPAAVETLQIAHDDFLR